MKLLQDGCYMTGGGRFGNRVLNQGVGGGLERGGGFGGHVHPLKLPFLDCANLSSGKRAC